VKATRKEDVEKKGGEKNGHRGGGGGVSDKICNREGTICGMMESLYS